MRYIFNPSSTYLGMDKLTVTLQLSHLRVIMTYGITSRLVFTLYFFLVYLVDAMHFYSLFYSKIVGYQCEAGCSMIFVSIGLTSLAQVHIQMVLVFPLTYCAQYIMLVGFHTFIFLILRARIHCVCTYPDLNLGRICLGLCLSQFGCFCISSLNV